MKSTNETDSKTNMPLITIVGILGKQGRSVAKTFLDTGRYRVRGITRRTDSSDALRLIAQGAELISLPLALGYKDEFVKAFQGSHAVFMMTPNIVPPQTYEFPLGKEMADAVVQSGAHHLIFSSLENVDKITEGKGFAPHFTDKARIEAYIRTLPITSSFIYMAFFYTNLMEFYTPLIKDDVLVFPIYLPEEFRAPFVDPLTATGPAVLEIVSHPDKYSGKSMPVIGDILSPREMIETFTKVTGKKAIYSSAFEREEFLSHFPGFKANEELVSEIIGMSKYAVEHGYFGANRDLNWSRRIDPGALTWEQFLLTTNWLGQKREF